jgi:hypothetical protein
MSARGYRSLGDRTPPGVLQRASLDRAWLDVHGCAWHARRCLTTQAPATTAAHAAVTFRAITGASPSATSPGSAPRFCVTGGAGRCVTAGGCMTRSARAAFHLNCRRTPCSLTMDGGRWMARTRRSTRARVTWREGRCVTAGGRLCDVRSDRAPCASTSPTCGCMALVQQHGHSFNFS